MFILCILTVFGVVLAITVLIVGVILLGSLALSFGRFLLSFFGFKSGVKSCAGSCYVVHTG